MLTVKEPVSMRYHTKIEKVVIPAGQSGDLRPIELDIESIADFNKAIDDMFAELEARGEQDLLAELCPYFGTVWASGRALAEIIAAEPSSSIKGQSFLEIGCGLAVPSMILLRLGAGRVVATDMHPDVGEFLERNLRRNQLGDGVAFEYRQVDWRGGHDEGKGGIQFIEQIFGDQHPDVVIASDVLYDRGQSAQVAEFLAQCMDKGTRRVILTDPGRPYLQEFVTAAADRGLHARLGSRVVPDPAGEVSVFVMEFTAR